MRELAHAMSYAAATVADPVLTPEHLTTLIVGRPVGPAAPEPAPGGFRPIDEELRELERSRMAAALRATGGNQKRAAALIAMPLRTFVAKLKQYQLSPRRGQARPTSHGEDSGSGAG